jgi:Arc/MetJ-type ribon-helix-helix transcriptional regulator
MSARKSRLTVTVDTPLVRVGQEAVKAGRAVSLSAWVNAALVEHAARERRRKSMKDTLAWYEKKFGAFTEEELAAIKRADREDAVVIRGRRSRGRAA